MRKFEVCRLGLGYRIMKALYNRRIWTVLSFAMAQRCVDQLMGRAERTEQEERRRTAVLDLREERDELDQLHLATCTAGCRETRDEWSTNDEQAEADCLRVIRQEDRLIK